MCPTVLAELSTALRSRPVGLRTLLLRHVGLSPAGSGLILQSLAGHFAASLALRHLDLSHNVLGEQGSAALCQFLAMAKGFGSLQWLDVSRCSLDTGLVVPVLRAIDTLEHVDLSENAAAPDCIDDLCLVAKLPAMRALHLAGMKLSGASARRLLTACEAARGRSCQLALDLSDNVFAPGDIEQLASAVAPMRLGLRALKLNSCRLTGSGLEKLLSALQRTDELEELGEDQKKNCVANAVTHCRQDWPTICRTTKRRKRLPKA